jgi:hypothetical protein
MKEVAWPSGEDAANGRAPTLGGVWSTCGST